MDWARLIYWHESALARSEAEGKAIEQGAAEAQERNEPDPPPPPRSITPGLIPVTREKPRT